MSIRSNPHKRVIVELMCLLIFGVVAILVITSEVLLKPNPLPVTRAALKPNQECFAGRLVTMVVSEDGRKKSYYEIEDARCDENARQ